MQIILYRVMEVLMVIRLILMVILFSVFQIL
uniref:Uncharacterized protein n=1 Tax=Siphoviridae sp. ctrpg19 TaxID=2826481 RepID=A0A8S5MK21_9CAUD|nr:MAG TPA: hypothetical protein [Siphoviridae sp. ctrpg19]